MAGIAGIEPTSYGSKPYTLTTMLNPYTSLVCPRCQASVRFVNTCVFFPYCQSVFPDSQKGNYMNNRAIAAANSHQTGARNLKPDFHRRRFCTPNECLPHICCGVERNPNKNENSQTDLSGGARLRIRTEISKQSLDLLSNSACRYQPAALHIVSDLYITHLHLYYTIRFSFYTADY